MDTIKYLNDPHLVCKIQRFFGVIGVNEHKKFDGRKSERGVSSDEICTDSTSTNGRLGTSEDALSSESDSEVKPYIITNRFWYYLFFFGTELGDEMFYASFIPFWFWNVDGAVGRRVVMVWMIVMYVGQGIKDILCMPRPSSPPAFRLQKKWALEYGMPSTHAMVGFSIPFSIILYTLSRYQYSLAVGLTIATLWCTVVSVSRLYLGMHSVLDIIAGLLLAIFLMVPVVPLVDALDFIILTNWWSPVVLFLLSILVIVFYPKSNVWTPTRGDTTMVVSVCVGVHIGAWTNYQLGQMSEPAYPPPYPIIWPSYEMIGLSVLRTAIGFSCILATRAICKSASYATVCALLRINPADLKKTPHTTSTSAKNTVELSYKYITYVLIGFNILYLLPTVFRLLSIDRPTFYTEI